MKANKNIKGKIKKAPLANQGKWFANVAKSFGFATTDIIREIVPATYEFVENTGNTYMDLVNDIRSDAMSEKMVDRAMSTVSPMAKLANQGLKNVLEDIKSGKFYNQERENAITSKYDTMMDEDMFGSFDDEDFDFGDDFSDDGDMEFTEEDNETGDTKVKVVQNHINQSPNVAPVARAVANSNITAGVATVESIQGLAAQQKTFEIQNRLNTTEFNTILFGTLSAINNNLSNIIAFKTENENKFITAGISFFGEQLELSKQIMEYQKGDTRSKEEKKMMIELRIQNIKKISSYLKVD